MPFGTKPKCCICKSNTSSMWRRNEDEEVVCNTCAVRTATINNHKNNASGCPFTFRKSTRVKSSKLKQQSLTKTVIVKGKSRRMTFKKSCTKSPPSVIVPISGTIMYHQGSYFQIGDVVSVVDAKEGVFYAQIRGLLEDQYCEKFALLTWLIPTTNSREDSFDLSTYLLGPEDEVPRKIDCLQFVSHCKLDYFMARDLTYPMLPPKPEFGIMLSRSGPQMVPLAEKEDIRPVTSSRGLASEC